MSPKIKFYSQEKLKNINPKTLKLWEKYKIDMSLRELSLKTISGYENDLQHFWIYIYDNLNNKSITDIDDDDITEFLYYCKSQGNNSRRIKRRMSSISSFYRFLRKKRIITENPMEFLDRPKKDSDVVVQTFLTMEQVNLMRKALIKYIDNTKTITSTHYAIQLHCYALFSLITMARVNAVSNIKWEQIDFEERLVSEVLEKEGYIVELYFNEEVKNLLIKLRDFRVENNINDNGHVFVPTNKKDGQSVSNGTMNQWCKVIGKMINVPTLHPHDFRHSYATILKNLGMPLEDVSKLLNHSGTDVTRKFYIRSDTTKLRASKDAFEI
jgi:site-specific recombinase XerD